MVVDQSKESKAQVIQRLLASMPHQMCKPLPTVCDTRGNARSSKTCTARQVLWEQWKASVPRKRRLCMDVSVPRLLTSHEPCPNTCYLAYFPNEIFRDAVKKYLINVYGRKLTNNVGATLTPRSPSVTSDSSRTRIGDVTRKA